MKAFVLEDFDAEPRLRDDLPEPQPGDGELVVRVRASSANPVDNAVAGGLMRDFAEYQFPVILGRDFAGVVEQAGSGADYAEGDEIFGFVDAADPEVHNGAWAELAHVPGTVARKPAEVDFAAAGAAPVAALTALAAIKALALKEGEPVADHRGRRRSRLLRGAARQAGRSPRHRPRPAGGRGIPGGSGR